MSWIGFGLQGGVFLVTHLGVLPRSSLEWAQIGAELHQRGSTPLWRAAAYFVTSCIQTKEVPPKFDISSNYSYTVPSKLERDGNLNALHVHPNRQNTSSTWTTKPYQAKWPLSVAPRLV